MPSHPAFVADPSKRQVNGVFAHMRIFPALSREQVPTVAGLAMELAKLGHQQAGDGVWSPHSHRFSWDLCTGLTQIEPCLFGLEDVPWAQPGKNDQVTGRPGKVLTGVSPQGRQEGGEFMLLDKGTTSSGWHLGG